ncbi:hypothetical protein SCLCIDRAFT_1217330 [Scleroderma citrinum Foug A]|uniref:Uncharacterized protein n=1 Tax=Scleroderma citrinum Foug A TaxID=1036808 RepID=A0A0C2ZDM2_9AGAM|nr:hypothetical protein SCLCIDRAFT_1217330 [Scleroderma citrinum Foug A]
MNSCVDSSPSHKLTTANNGAPVFDVRIAIEPIVIMYGRDIVRPHTISVADPMIVSVEIRSCPLNPGSRQLPRSGVFIPGKGLGVPHGCV